MRIRRDIGHEGAAASVARQRWAGMFIGEDAQLHAQ
jgi:hypothetical protein